MADAAWAAVVVAYESGDHLLGAVDSLLADTSAGGAPEVVVVDNGSSDGSVARLRATHPEVVVVTPARNLGYGVGANAGIAATTAPIVAVCNADLVAAAGTAGAVLDRFAELGIGAVGPRIVDVGGATYPSARVQPSIADGLGHALLGMWRPDNRFTRRYHERDADPELARDVDWVSGASIWLRRSALDSVGGWDESYFMYVEEVDLCWRLRRAGWRVAYEPRGVVTHVQGASTAHRPVRMIVEHHRSWYHFADRRWRGARRLLLLPVAVFLAVRAALLVALETGRSVAGRRPSDPKTSG